MQQICDSPNSPEIAIKNDIGRLSNFFTSATTSSISSIKMSIKDTTLGDEHST